MAKRLQPGDRAPDFQAPTHRGDELRLSALRPQGVALVLTRYLGCPICQMHTVELRRHAAAFAARGAALVVVYQSTPERLQAAFAEAEPGFVAVADPGAAIYAQYGAAASLAGFVHPGSLVGLLKATVGGHMHGRFEGREFQLPADFVIDGSGALTRVHYGRHTGDYSPPERLLTALP